VILGNGNLLQMPMPGLLRVAALGSTVMGMSDLLSVTGISQIIEIMILD
jgi:hypothetical protein